MRDPAYFRIREPKGVDLLRPLQEAFKRGTKRSRVRLLAIVCEKGHLLLEVFPSNAGPVILHQTRSIVATTEGVFLERKSSRRGLIQKAELLAQRNQSVPVNCRCHEEMMSVTTADVWEYLRTGRRRVVRKPAGPSQGLKTIPRADNGAPERL